MKTNAVGLYQHDTVSLNMGEWLRELREARNISMRALATRSRLSANALWMIEQGGYYLDGQPALSAEVDQRQIDIDRKLSFAERFYQGCSISETARKVVAYRIREENPRLSLVAANRMALQRAYSQCRKNPWVSPVSPSW